MELRTSHNSCISLSRDVSWLQSLSAPTCLKAWWGTDTVPVSSRYSSQLKSHTSWAESPSGTHTFKHTQTLLLYNRLPNILSCTFPAAVHRALLSYQTPVTPDSCWCPLKAETGSCEERNRGGLSLSSHESERTSTRPELWCHSEENTEMKI